METFDARQAAALPPTQLGGKAANLVQLGLQGFDVPPWFCLPTTVFDAVVRSFAGELDAAFALLDEDERRGAQLASERIRALFTPSRLGDEAQAALYRRFDAMFGADARVSVRSSAVGEDSGRDSFAGQMDTYLHVGRAALVERVLSCFASAFSARALVYRRQRGLGLERIAAAVIVQQMVESRTAGVLFTAHPTSGARDELVISAGLGLGEGVVGDLVETDTYYLDRDGTVLDQVIAEKRSQVAFDHEQGGGTRVVDVPSELAAVPTLDASQLEKLAQLGCRIEAAAGGAPQDIEWAIDQTGRLFLLQARPITTLERETIFDNANVVESYPGISSPLTFSFARAGYRDTFLAATSALGTSASRQTDEDAVFANLISLVDGRIYYNILNWYRLFQLVPGVEGAIPAWEKALGLTRRFVRPPKPLSLLQRLRRQPSRVRVAVHLIRLFFDLPDEVRRFEATFAKAEDDFRDHDLGALDAHQLVELYERIARRLFRPYGVSVVNDFFTQQLYEVLARLIDRFELGDASTLRNDLLCAESGMESVEPVRSLLSLTAQIRATPALRALFEREPDDARVWAALMATPEWAEFRAGLSRHLEQFGDRTLEELKLETPHMADAPSFVVAMFRNYLRGGQNLETMERHERGIRDTAERALAERLRNRPLRGLLFRFVLSRTRRGVKARENLRLYRSRGFGFVKRIFRALGAHLVARKMLDEADDVFFLTVDEVAGAVRGHSTTRDLRQLVALRRSEYERFAGRTPAPRLSVRGPVYAAPFEEAQPASAPADNELRGTGCSPGRVTAPAKVVRSVDQSMRVDGEILVAPMTDPGWVFLMVAAGGLVSEKGSILSHTAIIGRELGIPTVVGVRGATELIPDGAIVELDGQAGSVRVRPAAAAAEPAPLQIARR